MGKNKSKLVLDKNTVKSIKIKTEVKTGNPNAAGTQACVGAGPVGTSGNYTRNGGVASINL